MVVVGVVDDMSFCVNLHERLEGHYRNAELFIQGMYAYIDIEAMHLIMHLVLRDQSEQDTTGHR